MEPSEYGFTRDRDKAALLQPFLNPLPRSILRRGPFLLLDGEWRFELDLEDRGLRERLYEGHDYAATATWPGMIEAQMAVAQEVGQQALPTHDQVVAWYERDIVVPTEWLTSPECDLQVTFGACGYETRAWLNGHPLRTV